VASELKPRYGYDTDEVASISVKYYTMDGRENWAGLDDFCKWLRENGHRRGAHLKKRDRSKPHSPENSFFKEREEPTEKPQEGVCAKCPYDVCVNISQGCLQWRQEFESNWNRKICRKKKEERKDNREYFRYEHPDLVREGIV
jgi:hypothetical protein